MEAEQFEGRPGADAREQHAAVQASGTPGRWWLLAALPSVLVAVFSMRYLVPARPFPPSIVANAFASPWLLVHVAAAASALLVGPFQFLRGLRRRSPAVHRWLGRAYVLGCTVGAVSGMPLALGATTGMVSTAGFGLLSVAWLVATLVAWTAAMRRHIDRHRAWMLRSFALTLAAVTLRVYLPVLDLLPIAFEDGYRAISFLCWVPNLLLVETYLRRQGARRLQAPSSGSAP